MIQSKLNTPKMEEEEKEEEEGGQEEKEGGKAKGLVVVYLQRRVQKKDLPIFLPRYVKNKIAK